MAEIKYVPAERSDNWSSSRSIAPKGIVCHSTAWPGQNAEAIAAYFNAPGRGASIHAAVDDGVVIQCAPWTKRCGHVGSGRNGSLNDTHIGVELCEPKGLVYNSAGSAIIGYAPPDGYFDRVWSNAAELFAELCIEFGLDPLADGVILGHCEAYERGFGSNHADPMHWFAREGRTMADFRQAVAERIKKYTPESTERENDSGSEADKEDFMSYETWKEYMERYMAEPSAAEPSEWAKAACASAVERGIFKGDGDGRFDWHKPLTREAYAVLIERK